MGNPHKGETSSVVSNFSSYSSSSDVQSPPRFGQIIIKLLYNASFVSCLRDIFLCLRAIPAITVCGGGQLFLKFVWGGSARYILNGGWWSDSKIQNGGWWSYRPLNKKWRGVGQAGKFLIFEGGQA